MCVDNLAVLSFGIGLQEMNAFRFPWINQTESFEHHVTVEISSKSFNFGTVTKPFAPLHSQILTVFQLWTSTL